MHQPSARKPGGNKEIGAGQDTEDLERRSTSRKLKGEISNCPRHILPILQLCKLPNTEKGLWSILLEGQKPEITLPPKYFQEMTVKSMKSHCSPSGNGKMR